jgi:plastocyanin
MILDFDPTKWRGKMSKRPRLITTILCGFLLVGCGWSSGEASEKEAMQEKATHGSMDGMQEKKSQGGPRRGEMPKGASTEVVIDNFTFEPSKLTISAGTKVTWVNHDDVPHTATSTTKPRAFDSGTLDTDQKFSFVFATPGTYEYFCAVHPKMTGQIIVK